MAAGGGGVRLRRGAAASSTPAAQAATAPVDVAQILETAFPRDRIPKHKLKPHHALWLLYVPLGLIAVAVRFALLAFYFTCGVFVLFPLGILPSHGLWWYITWGCTSRYRVRYVRDDKWRERYEPADLVEGTPDDVKRLVGDRPHDTIFALDHHAWFLDATLFHAMMIKAKLGVLTLIGRGAATDPLVSLLCPPHHTLLMAPGQKLNEIVAEWRRRKIVAMAAGKQAPPLVLFPAGTTCTVDHVAAFQPRIFELTQPGESVRPVAVDVVSPMPFIEVRGLIASNLVDLVWYTFVPWWTVVLTVLPAVPDSVMRRPDEAAARCTDLVATSGTVKKTPVSIGLYEKKAWQRRVAARAIDGYKAGEIAALVRLQHAWPARLRWVPKVMHFVTLEPVIVLLGAALAMLGHGGGGGTSALFGPIGRALTLSMVAIHALKLTARVPRPVWVAGSALPVQPSKLGLVSHDYALPSGHAGFMGALWGVLIALVSQVQQRPQLASLLGASCAAPAGSGAAAGANTGLVTPWAAAQLCGPTVGWQLLAVLHVVMASVTVVAALARVYLSLHWPSDVASGAALGGAVGAAYGLLIEPRWMAMTPGGQLAAVAALAFAVAVAFGVFLSGRNANDEWALSYWSERAGYQVQPLRTTSWLLDVGVVAGVWAAAPLLASLVGAAPGGTGAAVAVAPLARTLAAAVGMATVAAAACAFMVVPRAALLAAHAQAVARGEKAARQAKRAHRLACLHFPVGIFLTLQAVSLSASVVIPSLGRALTNDFRLAVAA